MTLFMTELRVADFDAALAWYRDRLGLRVRHLDPPNRFALFQAGLALKGGDPRPGGATLHFLVSDLDQELDRLASRGITATPAAENPEGYREAFVTDPDGYTLGLFEWTE